MDAASPSDQQQQRDDVDRPVRCARCGLVLTDERARIEVHGRHAHTFMNPVGVIYEVRMFAEVPGAREEGAPDSETSWFPHTSWTLAWCSACRGHVGWRYRDHRDGATFYGLIASAITGPNPS